MKWEFCKISYLPSWLRVDNTVCISLNSRIILILQQLLICAKYLRSVECDNLVVNTTILIHLVLLDRFGSVCTAFWKWFIRFARVSTPMHKPILMGKVNNLLKSLYPYLINKCSSMNDNFMGRQKWTTFSYIQFLQKVWIRIYSWVFRLYVELAPIFKMLKIE